MEKKHDEQFQTLAQNLYLLLSQRYNVDKGLFSATALGNLTAYLGRPNNKQISNDDYNKLINIKRSLDEIAKGNTISEQELSDLINLYNYFKNMDKDKYSKVSELELLFRKLSMQSKDAIINENEFSDFKEYMHIKRPIEEIFEDVLVNYLPKEKKGILFIVGNVGDGKSHILSYMMKKHSKIFMDYNIKIHNDATETDSPTTTALETMKKILKPFTDDNIDNQDTDRLIVAINLGVLTNLIEELKREGSFNAIVNFLEQSQILSSRDISEEGDSRFKVISFTEQTNFILVDGKIKSNFYEEVINRIYTPSPDNPFYIAYQHDVENGMDKLLHVNYKYMMRKDFQKSIIYLLVRAEIEFKTIISTRSLFNFFYDICMPRDDKSNYDSYLPYLLFQNAGRSELLTLISTLDPIRNQTREIDAVTVELYQASDTTKKVSELLADESKNFDRIFQSFKDMQKQFNNFINTYLRIKFLINYEEGLFDNTLFKKYLEFYSTVQNGGQVDELFELVNESFSKWNGDSGFDGMIIKNPGRGRVKVLVEIDLEPINNFISGTGIGLKFKNNNNYYEVEIDYRCFEILTKLNKGYFLKEEDRQIAIKFDVFVSNVINSVSVMNKNILLDLNTRKKYELKKNMRKITLLRGGQ